MLATQNLYRAGQSLWLDTITRELLLSGTLRRYIDEFYVSGLTSNPTIFDHAMRNGTAYDMSLTEGARRGLSHENLFFEIALADLIHAAELFRPVYDRTGGVDGWVSLEVSPLLAHSTEVTITEAQRLHAAANRPNLYIKIPGTREGLLAIEEAIYRGVPINVTLLFSPAQYAAAAEAWLRGIERRISDGLSAQVSSVASLFLSRWDVAVAGKVPAALTNTLGLTIGQQAYELYVELLASTRWHRVMNAGARPQRLLFASTGTKDPQASDTLYIDGLVAPLTVNTVPEATLKAFADHGRVGTENLFDDGSSARVLADFAQAGINLSELGARLQEEGVNSFAASWKSLLRTIAKKTQT